MSASLRTNAHRRRTIRLRSTSTRRTAHSLRRLPGEHIGIVAVECSTKDLISVYLSFFFCDHVRHTLVMKDSTPDMLGGRPHLGVCAC